MSKFKFINEGTKRQRKLFDEDMRNWDVNVGGKRNAEIRLLSWIWDWFISYRAIKL